MPKQNRRSLETRVGLRIKELRAKTPFSQEALADRANLDRTYINSVENGKRNISIGSLAKITSGLGTSLREFFASDMFKD